MDFELSARTHQVTGDAAPGSVSRRSENDPATRPAGNLEHAAAQKIGSASIDPELALEQFIAAPNFRQLISRQDCEAGELIVACFRVNVAAGQQLVTLQVPLFPALTVVPTVEVSVIDRDDVRVRVTHRQRFGVRVELTFGSPLTYNSFMRVELNLLASG